MSKLIVVFIFLINYTTINSQEIDRLIDKITPNLCECIQKIENYKNLKIEFTNCQNIIKKKFNLTKKEADIYNIEIKKKNYLKSKILTSLSSKCCYFNKLSFDFLNQKILKRTILKSKIDSIITNKYVEGKKLSEYNDLFGYISFKVKIEKIKKENCNFLTKIYVKKNSLKFRVTSFFDKNITISDDEYYIFGHIESSPDGFFIQKNNDNEPYVFIHNVVNLRTLEMRGIDELL
ncbi:hypothetical protein [Tenacibaculum finnmarkense]|uniref:hypothetical protein n=1 Tax=Tenacibaculum finnmarkense TaxID=2781243 RepID=UPI001E3C664D|nr:hypothetical protein [Tenacibaculum finnmarkense]MCD8409052.1 hypothetical protein [Tenacibaculum finnmarkense genomovar ulcerans]